MNPHDNDVPRSDPYQIPPPPPGYVPEPTIPSRYGQVPPTVKASPPRAPKPPKPPKRKGEISTRRALFLYASMLVGTLVLCIVAANVMYDQSHQWTAIRTYDSYQSNHLVEAISIPNNNWRLVWQCTNTGTPQPIVIDVLDGNGRPLYPHLVDDVCQGGTQRGVTRSLSPNTVIIDIYSNSTWTVDVQEQIER